MQTAIPAAPVANATVPSVDVVATYPGGADGWMKHLEMIQGVISRLGQNSFIVKGWSVTLVGALFVLADPNLKWGALAPATAFWLLDAYYLQQERRFRLLFDQVRRLQQLSAVVDPFGMKLPEQTRRKALAGFLRASLSFSISSVHAPVVGMVALMAWLAAGGTNGP